MPKVQPLDAKPGRKLPARTPEARAKLYIARIGEPEVDPSKVKLKVTLYLPMSRSAAVRGSRPQARKRGLAGIAFVRPAIEQDKNFETLLRDILIRSGRRDRFAS